MGGRRALDLKGKRFTRLEVLRLHSEHPRSWWCRCDCGVEKPIGQSDLQRVVGGTMSCGCLRIEQSSKKRLRYPFDRYRQEHGAWSSMIQRCTNPNNPGWKNYGARGISVCNKWTASFDAFMDDMGPRPGCGWSIDRIDNDGNYEPNNCRWASADEQRMNRRVTIMVGDKTLQDAARIAGLPYRVVMKRIRKYGWSAEKALATPIVARSERWSFRYVDK